ncbi:hypothetical protein Vadar_030104 [Vaccinium darrowii]|uniref:Uncharacterized protein n=1 Tax=Vaccinium darrowii TaxID=229202 RepID=A0ACB7ZMH2_9ERIC|nr:hypothetical protein Vadar_030104 [Vaccinium darrowii]
MGVPKPQSLIGTKRRAPALCLTYMGVRRVCAVKNKVCVLSVKKHRADESSKLYEKRATPVSVTYLGVRRVCAIKNKVCVLSVKKNKADESSKLYEKRATPVSVTYLGVRRVCAVKNKAWKDGVAKRMFSGSGEPNDSSSSSSSSASSVGSCSGGNGNTWFKLPFCAEEDAESLCSDAESFCGCGYEEGGGFVSKEEDLWGGTSPSVEVPKKKVKKRNVPVTEIVYGGMPPADAQKAVEKEFEMALQDRIMEETKDKKNAVEAYVYDMRNKVLQ